MNKMAQVHANSRDYAERCLDPSITFYGPHACDLGCGATIVKVANGHPTRASRRFDVPEGYDQGQPAPIIYPNTVWPPHVCKGKD